MKCSNLSHILSLYILPNSREHMTGLSYDKNHVLSTKESSQSNSGEQRTGSNMSYILPKNGEHKYLSYIFHPHMLPNHGEHMICLNRLNNFQFCFYLHFCPEDPKILPNEIIQ